MKMDLKSFAIGLLVASLAFMLLAWGGSKNGRYAVAVGQYGGSSSVYILDTQTGETKTFSGRQVGTFSFVNESLTLTPLSIEGQ
ncbi:hypothetical protein PCS_02640 [Desulfocurvibacter africanus PCS]|uniref:Uncharacterized protein n=1 Tax=Desulfocurvibacter africanus PCS TaxID=1262666 RepID=M5Q1K3_DESAF|nr:hypothetical protein [Desulfocurvibacter africanus]EMG36628.1 hypothetical protein PCS_02640 [Desulfocurvibacter africanus PCS]